MQSNRVIVQISKQLFVPMFMVLWGALALFGGKAIAASADEVVELPTEELARESVYPVFDKPISVKTRNIITEGKLEGRFFYGVAMSEPIFNVSRLALGGAYHFSENHSLGLIFAKNSSGLSTYSNQLDSKYNLDFSRAPYPEYSILADYNFNAYYGKLSVTKKGVYNTTTLLSTALGVIKYIHKTYPAAAIGVGEKVYFTKKFSIRLDLRLYINQAPIPFLANHMTRKDPKPNYNDFDERITYTNNLELGTDYIF